MSIEKHSSRPSPYPWYLETNKGALSPDSPEAKSFLEQRLIPENTAISGLTIHLIIKNRQEEPLQDVRLFELFSDFAEAIGLDPNKKDDVKSVVRELEGNADQYSDGLTDASLTRLDALPGMMGVVVSNVVPDAEIDKVRQDDDLFEATGDDELDVLIARLKTSGRGMRIADSLTDGHRGRFEYNDYTSGSAVRKIAAYAIFSLNSEHLSNGDTTLAA